MRHVGETDLVLTAVGVDVALHASVEREVAARVNGVGTIAIAQARHACSRRSITHQTVEPKSSAVALVAALAERRAFAWAIGEARVWRGPVFGVERRVGLCSVARASGRGRVGRSCLRVVEVKGLRVAAAEGCRRHDPRAPTAQAHGGSEMIPSASSRDVPFG